MDESRRDSELTGDTPGRIDNEASSVGTGANANGNGSHPDDWIARRAYQRFEDRGREHGHDLDDWLEAERELISGEEQ
jgi:hypothetical protein